METQADLRAAKAEAARLEEGGGKQASAIEREAAARLEVAGEAAAAARCVCDKDVAGR